MAKQSRLLAEAQTLAEWVGTGRPVTARGVPKPAAAVEACGVLGIDLPSRKPRSALDIDELMKVWSVAVAAGFVVVSSGRAAAGPELAAWTDGDAEAVVAVWTQGALGYLGLVGDLDKQGVEHLAVLAGLHERGGRASLDELGDALAELDDAAAVDCSCPECACGDLGVDQVYADDAAADMADFGVATLRGDVVELTELGNWLTDFMFVQSAVPADVEVGVLLMQLEMLPVKIAMMMCRPWLSARTPAVAANELIAVAARVLGQTRLTALALARECGPEAAPAWRDWANDAGVGAYARVWLAELDEREPADADEAWILVDTVVPMLGMLPPGLPAAMLGQLLQDQIGAELAEALPLLANCDHPDAPRLVSLLTARPTLTIVPPGANPLAEAQWPALPAVPGRADSTYQIKVQLRDVTKPPVWRRLQVPDNVGLDWLHEVIQRAMGWDDSHLHVFSRGSARYGVPDGDLDFRDERKARLSKLLTRVGDKIGYDYDFGDDWHHDITLEEILPRGADAVDAVCTAGKGACPPEDCGGPWGYEELKATLADPDAEQHDEMVEWMGLDSGDEFDPAEFSVDEVNRSLG